MESQLLASTWPTPGYHGHLGSELADPANEKFLFFCLFFLPSLPASPCQRQFLEAQQQQDLTTSASLESPWSLCQPTSKNKFREQFISKLELILMNVTNGRATNSFLKRKERRRNHCNTQLFQICLTLHYLVQPEPNEHFPCALQTSSNSSNTLDDTELSWKWLSALDNAPGVKIILKRL